MSEDHAPMLRDWFDGRAQLVVYHFMFAPDAEQGCPMCTQFASGIAPGVVQALADANTTIALASRAAQDKLVAWRGKHGWPLPWHTMDDEFAREYGSLTDDGDVPAINVFVRDGERVLHTFDVRGREAELMIPAARWMAFTPAGSLD